MTRRRVAVVSSCAPPLPGHPVTGGGLRTAQLIATLRSDKHSVVTLIEGGALPDGAPKDLIPFAPETLGARLREAKPSVIVLEQWALASWLGEPAEGGAPDVPLVIDLHGSLLLENVYRRGSLDVVLDGKTKLDALRRADLLLTPAAAQVHHFGSWAALAGFDPRELPLELLPLATPGAVPPAREEPAPKLRMVYGGARWPWIDSLAALEVAADVVTDRSGSRLDVFTYEPPRHGMPFEEDLGSWADVDRVLEGRGKRIVRHGRTEHAAWLAFLTSTATVALDLWEPNPERMLAATTRTIEFLAAGLPVVTMAGACWAEELVATGAGWSVPAGPGFRQALSELLAGLDREPERIVEASRAATALATRRADPRVTGRALLDFVEHPTRPPRSAHSVVQAIVSVRQAHLDETLRSQAAAHSDEHARLVAEHRAETTALRERHAAEVSELRAAAQKELSDAREGRRQETAARSAEHRVELEQREAGFRKELGALRVEEQRRADEQRAERRAEIEAMAAAQSLRMAAAAEEAKADRERAATEADERLRNAAEETRRVIQANDARFAEAASAAEGRAEAQAAAHRLEMTALRDRLEAEVARRQAKLDSLANANEELQRQATAELEQVRSELQGQAAAELAQVRSELQGQAAAELEQVRSELQGQIDAFASRNVVRIADGAARALGQTGRVLPATRLARLWAEHALDRERD